MSNLLKLNPDFKPAFDGVQLAGDLISKIHLEKKIITAYLFGSSAEFKNTENSDLDILLVIPDQENETDYYKIVQQPFFSNRAVDWIIKKATDFEKRKNIGGVCMTAFQNGIVIYND